MKKERKKYKRAFELEWTFGEAAMVHGLKYNPREDSTECSKRKRDDSEQDEGPRTVRTRTVSV